MRHAIAAASIFALSLILNTPSGAAAKPNVLFIAIDDLNDWLGCLGGHQQVKSPHIDGLAKRGTLFLNAHCQAPLCNPSRTSVLLGQRPSATGIYGLQPWFREVEKLKDLIPLPEYFAKNGYHTIGVGKVFHSRFGFRKGDQEFHETGPSYDDGPYPKERLAKQPGKPSRGNDWGVIEGLDEDRGDWKIASWAVEKLNAKPKEPFFLSVGIRLPHVPLFATQKWFDLYPDDRTILPPILRGDRDDTPRASWYLHWKLPEQRRRQLEDAAQWQDQVRAYLACISFLDSQVGRVLDALKKSDLEQNTIVVLWSDHGWHLGEKAITGKNSLWKESTRVPLIFAGPGISAGERCHETVELLDIYPTLIELCGLPTNRQLEGRRLGPQLRDAKARRGWPAITTANRLNHAVRSRHHRYIRYADGSEEFYDLAVDPNEWKNVVNDPRWAKVVAEHRRWVPRINARLAPGSSGRTLQWKDGKAIWEGEEIPPGAPIPGL